MSNQLVELITTVSKRVIRKEISKVPKCWVAIVDSASTTHGNMCDIYLSGDATQPVISVINRTNETLVASDKVYVFSPTGTLNSCVILFKG